MPKKFRVITRINPAQAKMYWWRTNSQQYKSTLDANKELSNTNAIWENHSIDGLKQIISSIYKDAVKWNTNLFMLLSGNGGENYIDECIRPIRQRVNNNQLQ